MPLCQSEVFEKRCFRSSLLYAYLVKHVLPFAIFFCLSNNATALTLQQAFEAALAYKPGVKVQRNLVEKNKWQKKQAWGAVMPSLSLSSQHSEQDAAVSFGSADTYTHTAKISLEQSLFSGLKEFHALSIASRNIEASENALKDYQLNLRLSLARLFYKILSLQQEYRNLQEQESILQKRVTYLRSRAKIGRSKQSEVVSARSQLARISADMALNQSELALDRRTFFWMTGRQADNLQDNTAASALLVDPAWEKQIETAPDILQAQQNLKIAEKQASVAWSDYLPTATLAGNYYLDRPARLEASKWDATLLLSWNFFAGGVDRAEYKIKQIEVESQRFTLEESVSQKEQEYSGRRDLFRLKQKTMQKLKVAVDLARESYQAQQAEFARGLVSNLEVLRALDDYVTVKKQYDSQRFALKIAYVELQTLAGVGL